MVDELVATISITYAYTSQKLAVTRLKLTDKQARNHSILSLRLRARNELEDDYRKLVDEERYGYGICT